MEASDQLALVLVESADESKRSRAKEISEAIINQTPTLRRSIATAAWIEFKLGSFEVADGMFGVLTKTGNISLTSLTKESSTRHLIIFLESSA